MGSEIVQWNNYMLKNVVSKKFICLDYIKLHGAHGNPSRAVAGSEARPLYLQKKTGSTLAHGTYFHVLFLLPLIQGEQTVSY